MDMVCSHAEAVKRDRAGHAAAPKARSLSDLFVSGPEHRMGTTPWSRLNRVAWSRA